MTDRQERKHWSGVASDVTVCGDVQPTKAVLLEDGRGRVVWDEFPARVVLYGMSPQHMRNLAQVLIGLAAEAEQGEVAA